MLFLSLAVLMGFITQWPDFRAFCVTVLEDTFLKDSEGMGNWARVRANFDVAEIKICQKYSKSSPFTAICP